MKIIFSLLLLLISSFSWSQNFEYFDSDWEPCSKEQAHYFRVKVEDQQKGLLFVKDYWADGSLQMTGSYKLTNTEMQHGYFVWYYKSGQILNEVAYKNHVKTGPEVVYFENGNKKTELFHDRTSLPWPYYRVSNSFDQDETILVKDGKGIHKIYYESGDLSEEGPVENGLRSGVWKGFYKSGLNKFEETYKKGNLKKGVSWSLNGLTFPYKEVRKQPKPRYGYQTYYSKVAEILTYPEGARVLGIEGKVFVKFTVTAEGTLKDVHVVKGLGYGCDEAAIRAVSSLNDWKPGEFRGRKVDDELILPLNFRLTD